MSGFRIRGGAAAAGHPHRPEPPQPQNDFYDERRSRSRSPDRRYDSPHRRRTPELSRTPPSGPAAETRYNASYSDRRHDSYVRTEHHHRRSFSPRRERPFYHDRDHERYRSPSEESHDRSRSRSRSSRDGRQSSRGRASKEIIMEGLAAHLTEDDISGELNQHYHVDGLDDVRVIRDRQTKLSRQFGFLRFATLQQAQSFMDQNYPTIYIYGDSSSVQGREDPAKVRIAYSRERKEQNRDKDEPDWICHACNINNFATRTRCFRCQSFKADSLAIAPVRAVNVGDNDASPDNTPSQFLLFRGLEPSVSEELFIKGVGKLFKPSGQFAQLSQLASKKTSKVASTTGDANLGARDGTLRRILLVRDRKSNESWRFGFAEFATIDDAQAALVRYNSFDRFTIASKQVLVSYVHAGVFVPVLNPTASTLRFTFSPLSNPAVKLAYWDENAYATELVVTAGEPQPTEAKGSSAPTPHSIDHEGFRAAKEAEKTKKRKADAAVGAAAATKKAAPSHLQFWSNRHAELHGLDQKPTQSTKLETRETSPAEVTRTTSQSYADPQRNCCYLCSRQFSSTVEVNKHERLSELHRQNLKDPAQVQKALAKLEKHRIQPQPNSMEYRDRARERRKVYGVVNKKGEQVGNGTKAMKATSDDEQPVMPSKGASLLSKMGYTAGQGLGASGEGMVAPINQDVYVAGVGLGAQGGKVGNAVTEAERNTKGEYSGFAERTRETARERYSRM